MELTKEVRQRLLRLPTGNIADNNNAAFRQGVMDTGIKPLDRKMKMIGRAFTARCAPGDNLGLHQALNTAQPGDVLVIDVHGYSQAGHFGDMMATACKVRGLAGVVIDGSCRDASDICALGFPVFSRGVNPSGTTKAAAAVLNVPVSCGGIIVNPGDLVFGDGDGVVVIPQEDEDNVLRAAEAKYEHEKDIIKELQAGKRTMEIYGFHY